MRQHREEVSQAGSLTLQLHEVNLVIGTTELQSRTRTFLGRNSLKVIDLSFQPLHEIFALGNVHETNRHTIIPVPPHVVRARRILQMPRKENGLQLYEVFGIGFRVRRHGTGLAHSRDCVFGECDSGREHNMRRLRQRRDSF